MQAQDRMVQLELTRRAYETSAYASAASEAQRVPYEFFVLGQALGLSGPYRPAPWQPEDTVAVGNFHTMLTKAAAKLAADRASILKTGVTMRVLSHGGSNAIAVSPSRSADGDALLWGAPQEGFGTPSVDGEQYLGAPGYDAGGMYVTGEPFVLIGRNANVAWTSTSEELVDPRVYIEHNVNYAAAPPGITTHCGTSASQDRSTFMMAVDAGPHSPARTSRHPGRARSSPRLAPQPAPVRPGGPVQRLPLQEHAAAVTR
jgi:Penicillin amidase